MEDAPPVRQTRNSVPLASESAETYVRFILKSGVKHSAVRQANRSNDQPASSHMTLPG